MAGPVSKLEQLYTETNTENKYLPNNGTHLMDQSTKKLVYYSHIASHIQYGLLLWGNNVNKDQLNILQKTRD